MNTDWRDSAACRGADTDLFFPDWATGSGLRDIEDVKLICRDCPVRALCLDWALDRGVAFGIWGGFTEEERRAIRGTLIRRRLFSGSAAADG
jgi:WhiB family redox-sensing transcriptional regulator